MKSRAANHDLRVAEVVRLQNGSEFLRIQLPRNGRKAIALVEAMTVVALSTIVLGLIVSLLVALQQWDRRVHRRAIQNAQRLRLGELIRADIRNATDVARPAENTLQITKSSADEVRYELSSQGCRRVVEESASSGPINDLFAIPPASSWAIAREEAGKHPLVIVTLNLSKPDDAKAGPTPLLVYGALGADSAAP